MRDMSVVTIENVIRESSVMMMAISGTFTASTGKPDSSCAYCGSILESTRCQQCGAPKGA